MQRRTIMLNNFKEMLFANLPYIAVYYILGTLAIIMDYKIVGTVLFTLAMITISAIIIRSYLINGFFSKPIWVRLYLPARETSHIYNTRKLTIDNDSIDNHLEKEGFTKDTHMAFTHAYDGPVFLIKEDDVSPSQHTLDTVYFKVKVDNVELKCLNIQRNVGRIFYGHTSLFIVKRDEVMRSITEGDVSHIRPKGYWNIRILLLHLASLFSASSLFNFYNNKEIKK